jgi:hypothetical protein
MTLYHYFRRTLINNQTNKMKKIYTLLSLMIISFASSAQCSDLFFSEYIEGSGVNKALEIYNPTSSDIALDNYYILMIRDGGTSSTVDSFGLAGQLTSNNVYVIGHSGAASTDLKSQSDTLINGGVLNFNGDDCVYLINRVSGDTADVFGTIGTDPGSSWTWNAGGVSYESRNSTLTRNYNVQSGIVAWDTLEWSTSVQDDVSNLGSHSSACHPPTATEPSTAAADPTAEAVDVISIYSQSYTNPAGIDYFPNWGQNPQGSVFEIGMASMIKYPSISFQGVDFSASDIDASSMEMLHIDIWTADVDSVLIFPISRATGERSVNNVITAGQWNSIDIPLSDFTSKGLSMADIWQFKFDNIGASRGTGTIFIDNMYFWKEPTLVYNVADIADIVGLDADFSPVNLDTLYEVTGIVYGIDYQGGATRTQFTIIDATDGVGVYTETALDYVVKEGDEVTVKGPLGFFRGLTQIIADSITVVSTGNAIKDPTDVTSLSEDTESDLVKFTKVWLVDNSVTEWASGNTDLTNGTDTFAVRVDSDTKGIVGMTIEDTMNIVGLGGQFKFDAPYEGGYQLFPRDSSDITKWKDLSSVKEVTVDARVYPNPASKNLTVIGAQKWNTYVVYNILGGKVSEGTLTNNNLSVANLNNGTYIVKLYAGENTGVSRFVVNK